MPSATHFLDVLESLALGGKPRLIAAQELDLVVSQAHFLERGGAKSVQGDLQHAATAGDLARGADDHQFVGFVQAAAGLSHGEQKIIGEEFQGNLHHAAVEEYVWQHEGGGRGQLALKPQFHAGRNSELRPLAVDVHDFRAGHERPPVQSHPGGSGRQYRILRAQDHILQEWRLLV
ncbi:MAG: hypothetical protein FJX76_19705, partial [Armatimonadetes bacterium]|nr:hypothetical protein [Armatimonadota bacterium]